MTNSVGKAQPAKSTHSRVILAFTFAYVALRAIPSLAYPLGRDQATFCYIAEQLLHGKRLYLELWDNKPPGIFYIYVPIVKIFDHVMWSVGVLDILWLVVISICIFCFARRYLGTLAAAIAVVCTASWHSTWGYIHALQPETFIMLFIFGAYFLLVPDRSRPYARHFAAGLVLGAAFWTKYNAVTFFPVLAFLPYLDFSRFDEVPRRVRMAISWREWVVRMLVLGGGFAVTVAVVLTYFWWSGAWAALMEVQFEVLPRYGSMFLERMPHYGRWVVKLTYLHLGPVAEAAAGLTLLVAWSRRRLSEVAPVLLMALAGFVSMAMQLRYSSYTFETCYLFFAMLIGYVVAQGYEAWKLARQWLARRGWRVAHALTWVVALQLIYLPIPAQAFSVYAAYQRFGTWRENPGESYKNYLFPHPLEMLPGQMAVINYLKKHSVPGDKVYIWGTAPLVNFLTQRETPSRFVSNMPLMSSWGPARWRKELMRGLKRNPPRFIVVARNDNIIGVTFTWDDSEQWLKRFPEFRSFLTTHYQSVLHLWTFEIYCLKSSQELTPADSTFSMRPK